ncbi:MAG: hypothetical protein HC799_02670 [Limnothrix sp. RL_2_0]|nr:hypothetical protein [Limnothrix sp. RL_2_0]
MLSDLLPSTGKEQAELALSPRSISKDSLLSLFTSMTDHKIPCSNSQQAKATVKSQFFLHSGQSAMILGDRPPHHDHLSKCIVLVYYY